MQQAVNCISCGENRAVPVCLKNSYQVVRCSGCGLIYVDPMPSESEICDLYRQGDLVEESVLEEMGDGGFVTKPSWKIKEFSEIIRQIGKLTAPGRILDVGSLWGLFMELAQEAGWETYGIEPWNSAVEYCRNKLGLKVTQGTLTDADFTPGYFDAVVMLDVLEHCPNPRSELRRVSRVLKDGGIICVLSPNVEGLFPVASKWLHRLSGQSWAYLIPPFHLYDFSPSTLGRILTDEGFQIIQINYLGLDTRIQINRKDFTLRTAAKKTLSFVGRNLSMGERMAVYACKQDKHT